MTLTLDKKDHTILGLLKQNSRLSVRDIAKKTGIKPSTVHQRLQKLIKANIIEKFTLKLNNTAVGQGFIAFLLVAVSGNLEEQFFKNQFIKEAFSTTGEYDLMLKLKFKDIAEFNDYIISLKKESAISKMITIVSTNTLKEEMN